MKKIILLFASIMLSTTCIYSQEYKNSIGIVAGSLNGLSYKTFVKENVAVQTDLAFGLLATRGTVYYAGYAFSGEEHVWTFQLQPNVYYQKNIHDVAWGGIDAFVGGGASLGYAEEFGSDLSLGKFGLNAIAGIELILVDAPITVGLDFRPGYGMLFANIEDYMPITMHVFDWALAASVRYRF